MAFRGGVYADKGLSSSGSTPMGHIGVYRKSHRGLWLRMELTESYCKLDIHRARECFKTLCSQRS